MTTEEDIESKIEFWKTRLIIFTVEMDISMNAMRQYTDKVCNFISVPNLYYLDEGYSIARFWTVEERNDVLQNGPYAIFSILCSFVSGRLTLLSRMIFSELCRCGSLFLTWCYIYGVEAV